MAEARWLEVSLTVDGELAEAVADVIGRFTSQGVVMEQAVRYNDTEDEGTPYGPIKVFGYMVVDSTLEQRRLKLEEALWHLSQIQPLPPAEYREVEDQDWMAAWREHYRPIPIGEKLMILPAWIESPDEQRIPIKIDPSMAFGTGTHPTTQLCLALMEKHLKAGQAVIDIGCGSGILSIAAVKLGASRVVAVDIDQAAIRSTRDNAALNEVTEQIDSGVGSLGEILLGYFSLRRAPLVLANILAPVIIRMLGEGLADTITKGGKIILSGILDEQSPAVEAEAEMHGLQFVERMIQNDWVGLVYQKP
ncbi:MAG: 50S ribosomal protein L11 methyltransferase [Bellilinea sp.]|nr:50S ribosomal protein L11 methyltransferase [Bellilinea sp.]